MSTAIHTNDWDNNEDAGDCALMGAADFSEEDGSHECPECGHRFNSEWWEDECPECDTMVLHPRQ